MTGGFSDQYDQLPVLSPDEIAWLATQSDVESRLVFTSREAETAYQVENGPFRESDLARLPARDWTLLVQDVDKHLPAFRAWFELAPFVPDFRFDDLMVSVAAPGGSVGPHVDRYDVFLCQGTGQRTWSLGRRGDYRQDESCPDLSLVTPYEADQSFIATQGDILYLPPDIPHWGVADELCVTYSIGLLAPTGAELAACATRLFDRAIDDVADSTQYEDPDLCQGDAAPGCISPDAVARLRAQNLLPPDFSNQALAQVLGATATDPKAWLAPDPAEPIDGDVSAHGMALLAWYDDDDVRLAFANGEFLPITPEGVHFMQRLCAARHVTRSEQGKMRQRTGGSELLDWLYREGAFDAQDRGE